MSGKLVIPGKSGCIHILIDSIHAVQLSLWGSVLVHITAALIPALPLNHARYPDIATYLCILYGAVHFHVAWLIVNALCVVLS